MYQIGQLPNVERSGLPFEGLPGLLLQNPIESAPDFVLRQLHWRRTVGVRRARVQPHQRCPFYQRGDPTVEEGVEHPHPVKAMLQQLLELHPDDLQLVLPVGGAL